MSEKITVKSVKHVFTFDEREALGGELARAHGALRNIEKELEQVKSSYKAKTAEAEARIDCLSTNITNGFEMRNERCRVVLNPKKRQKLFYLEEAPRSAEPVIIEEMTPDDFQPELVP
jgi:hypothetical protein